MPSAGLSEKKLAEATGKIIDSLHQKYNGIKIKAISSYEDEDFTIQISIPKELSIDQVEKDCHVECIKAEDEYDLFIFPKVVYGD